MNFVALDFETANSDRGSACEIGLVIVENFKILKQQSFLIKPKQNWFENTWIHGIDEAMVENEPEFDVIYQTLKPIFEKYPLLAHYATFDMSVLRHLLDDYGLPYPNSRYSCTYQLAKEHFQGLLSFRLDAICDHLNIKLDHHRALSDALACAKIGLQIFRERAISNFLEIEEKFPLNVGELFEGGYKPSAKKSNSYHFKISEIEFEKGSFKTDNPFYNKSVVFTGTLQSLIRKDAQRIVLEIGGQCTSGVTKKTNYLVVGEQDYKTFGEGFISSKMKKAIGYLKAGNNIELITESQFLEMI